MYHSISSSAKHQAGVGGGASHGVTVAIDVGADIGCDGAVADRYGMLGPAPGCYLVLAVTAFPRLEAQCVGHGGLLVSLLLFHCITTHGVFCVCGGGGACGAFLWLLMWNRSRRWRRQRGPRWRWWNPSSLPKYVLAHVVGGLIYDAAPDRGLVCWGRGLWIYFTCAFRCAFTGSRWYACPGRPCAHPTQHSSGQPR